MNPRICLCCGEPMPAKGNALSRNPNICASCSSIADGMEESNLPQTANPIRESSEVGATDRAEEPAPGPVIHHFPT